jgi:hypothetical protein
MSLLPAALQAQEKEMGEAEAAIKIGSAKELSKHFSDNVEISFEGKKSNYSKTQAEFVLRDFFSKNEANPNSFENYHRGNSGKSLNYSIVKYSSKNGSFRVFMKIKQHQSRFVIDSIDINKE